MFTKLYGDILQSSLWSESAETRLVWITLLALADQDGFVHATVPGIAHQARVALAETRKALEIFEAPDPESRNPKHDGRRIERVPGGYMLLNFGEYHAKTSIAAARAKTATDKGDGVNAAVPKNDTAPTPSASQSDSEWNSNGDGYQPPSSAENTELGILVKQFVRTAKWVGNPKPVYEHFRAVLDEGHDLSAKIAEHVVPGLKPWEFVDIIRGRDSPQSGWNKVDDYYRLGNREDGP